MKRKRAVTENVPRERPRNIPNPNSTPFQVLHHHPVNCSIHPTLCSLFSLRREEMELRVYGVSNRRIQTRTQVFVQQLSSMHCCYVFTWNIDMDYSIVLYSKKCQKDGTNRTIFYGFDRDLKKNSQNFAM